MRNYEVLDGPFLYAFGLQNNGRNFPLGRDRCEVSHKCAAVNNCRRNGEAELRNDTAGHRRHRRARRHYVLLPMALLFLNVGPFGDESSVWRREERAYY